MERGYRTEFVLMRAEGELLSEVPTGATIVDLKASRFRHGFLPLVRYLQTERPCGIVAAMWPLTGMAALAARLAGLSSSLVLGEHVNLTQEKTLGNLSDLVHRRLGRFIYGRRSEVVAVSKGVRDDLADRIGMERNKVKVIYNPVASQLGKYPADVAIVNRWKSGRRAIIAIGSFKTQKDYPNLLQSLHRLQETRDARLLILGEGSLRGELEHLVSSLGLQDSVLMPGFVPDPYPYLAHADLFVLSSAWEGLPGVLIEALVAGVPVVSTDCPSGPAEILENGTYGRLVPVGDSEALAAAMAEALDVQHDRDMLRRRGNEFSVERAADQYLALLDPDGKMLACT